MLNKKIIRNLLTINFIFQLFGCGGGGSISEDPPPIPLVLGEITINITGLPEDVDADVYFVQFHDSAPSTIIWDITETRTFTNLTPGIYSVRSTDFSIGLTQYDLITEKGINVELLEGATETVDVTYSPRDIAPATVIINTDISAVPQGEVIPPMTLLGPEDFSQDISVIENIVIENLAPGRYRLIAPDFTVMGVHYGFALDGPGLLFLVEGEVLTENARIRNVPVRMKSIFDKPSAAVNGVVDSFGNSYSIDNVPNGITFGVSSNILQKWDLLGNSIWSVVIPDQTYSFWSWKINLDANDNIYLAGFEDRGNLIDVAVQNLPVQVYKYNSSGQQLWSKELPSLTGGELALVDAVGAQNGKVAVFATKRPIIGNVGTSREAHITIMDATNGNVLDAITDTSIDMFRQLKVVADQGYWIFATNKIIHYSINGNQIESLFTGNGVVSTIRPINGGVVFQPDPAGGLFVATSINGAEDVDVEFTRYDADFTVEWQQILSSQDTNVPLKMAYDANLSRVIFQFNTNGLFNGVEGVHALVEWDKSGQRNWLRQLSTFFGGIESIEADTISGDWKLKLSSKMGDGGGHYGVGNVITIGP